MINMLCTINWIAADVNASSIVYDGKLDPIAWTIIAVMLTIILGGLGWCFYRAVTAAKTDFQEQYPDEV